MSAATLTIEVKDHQAPAGAVGTPPGQYARQNVHLPSSHALQMFLPARYRIGMIIFLMLLLILNAVGDRSDESSGRRRHAISAGLSEALCSA